MAPNDIELTRVWTRKIGGTVAHHTFPSGTGFEIVVDCESGASIQGSGSPWEIGICVRDLCDNNPIVFTATQNGSLGSPPWISLDFFAVFTIPAPTPAQEGHIWEVVASLKVRPIDPDMSFSKSALFCITAP